MVFIVLACRKRTVMLLTIPPVHDKGFDVSMVVLMRLKASSSPPTIGSTSEMTPAGEGVRRGDTLISSSEKGGRVVSKSVTEVFTFS